MEDLEGKVAVVTGGGSGIGRGEALAFADAGMHVVIADIDAEAGLRVRAEVESRGVRAVAIQTDVSNRASVEALAEQAFLEMGAVHVVCNNAGVATGGPLADMSDGDWAWVLGVNLYGVIHGIQSFVPRLIEQGHGGHVVNTSSLAGLVSVPGLGIYNTTKFAVVAISETLRFELAEHSIGVSVLCPGIVKTRIGESARNRPEKLGGARPDPFVGIPNAALPPERRGQPLIETGMEPEEVGRDVARAVRENELYVLTHPAAKAIVEKRFERILAAFDHWAEHKGAKSGG